MEESKTQESKVEYVDDYTIDKDKCLYVDNYKIPVYKMQDNTKKVEDEIKQFDVEFNATKFLEIAKRMFQEILDAQTTRDTALLKAIESDALYVQHKEELAEDIEKEKRHIYENPSIKYVALNEISTDGEKEVLSVWLSVAVQDYFEKENTHELLTAKEPIPPLCNYRINFTRTAGTKSNSEIIKCNNCNAIIDIETSAKCQYCGTIIDVSKYTWIISTIETVKEINTNNTKLINMITEIDPLFSEEKFVAFVNKTFIKLQDAYSNTKLEDIHPYISETLYESLTKGIEQNKAHGNIEKREQVEIQDTYIQDIMIDSKYEKVTIYLEALLLIYEKDIEYNVVSSGTDKFPVIRKYNLELLRKVGLKTNPDKDIYTLNCVHCGAPFNLDENQRCAYCGTQVGTDEIGKTDWLLNDMINIMPKDKSDKQWEEHMNKKEREDKGLLNPLFNSRGRLF